MPRSLVFGNGNLLVALDNRGCVCDYYYPYAGLENHVSGHKHKIGVWVEGEMFWLEEKGWKLDMKYEQDTLVGKTTAVHEKLGLKIEINDICYNELNIFLRRFKISNETSRKRAVKIFFHQEFRISEAAYGTTVFFDPKIPAMVHYRGRRVFLVGATCQGRPFQEYAAGNAHYKEFEGTWRDAEDGKLSKHAIEHGIVDSVIGCEMVLEGRETELTYYWVTAGQSIEEAKELHAYVLKKGPQHLIRTTSDYWRAWVNKNEFTFYGLEPQHIELFKRSLLVIRTHFDNRGGVIASGDSDLLQGGKDTYAYVWPRDGVFTAMALDKAGYLQLSRRFYEYLKDLLYGEGYFMHKYLPDKSLGSSWHAWVHEGKPRLPIQEDEAALGLWGLWQYYKHSKDLEFIEEIYNSYVARIAGFLQEYRNYETGLPKESYDLWEEIYGVTTFTSSAVYGALRAAGSFAAILGKNKEARRYHKKADEVRGAILKYLYQSDKGYFVRSVNYQSGNRLEVDYTVDASSFYGVFHFGVLAPGDKRLDATFDQTKKVLGLTEGETMIARHENDSYYKEVKNTQGNPWIITTSWLAEYEIERSRSEEDIKKVLPYFTMIAKCALPSGILPEQVHSITHKPLSVAPLTWSHAQYVYLVLSYMKKLEELGVARMCKLPFVNDHY